MTLGQNEIRIGDIGTVFVATVKDGTTAVDISSASTKIMLFRKPRGKSISRAGAFVTDGTDGQLKYTVVAGDLSEKGIWEWQVRIVFPTGSQWSTDIEAFEVYGNLA